jgi:hypothetical protein
MERFPCMYTSGMADHGDFSGVLRMRSAWNCCDVKSAALLEFRKWFLNAAVLNQINSLLSSNVLSTFKLEVSKTQTHQITFYQSTQTKVETFSFPGLSVSSSFFYTPKIQIINASNEVVAKIFKYQK